MHPRFEWLDDLTLRIFHAHVNLQPPGCQQCTWDADPGEIKKTLPGFRNLKPGEYPKMHIVSSSIIGSQLLHHGHISAGYAASWTLRCALPVFTAWWPLYLLMLTFALCICWTTLTQRIKTYFDGQWNIWEKIAIVSFHLMNTIAKLTSGKSR